MRMCCYRNDRWNSEAPHDRPVVRSCYVKMMVLMRVICSLFIQGLSPSYTSMLCLSTWILRVPWNSKCLLNILYLHCIAYSSSLLNGVCLRTSCVFFDKLCHATVVLTKSLFKCMRSSATHSCLLFQAMY